MKAANTPAGRAPWRAARSLCLYAAAAAVATAFFFWLHHLGNGIPYELAQQRFADAPLIGAPDSDGRIASPFEYCQIAGMVLAGAREDGGYGPLVDAVLLRGLNRKSSNYCPEAKAASDSADVNFVLTKSRYWWGGKALFAISLRWLSVVEFFRFVEMATAAAWLSFAGAMAAHGWRALAAASPPAAFGLAFSGTSDFSGPANGLPYLWAVGAAVVLALLLARRHTARAASPFCFVAGAVSSYLWLFEGHNFLVVALFGLVAWLAREHMAPRARAGRALSCIALYIAGFAACFILGQVTKAAVFDRTYGGGSGIVGGPVAKSLFHNLKVHATRTLSPERRDRYDLTNRAFVEATPSMTEVQGSLVIDFSIIALASAVAGAVFLARRRGEFDPAWTCLWFVGLILAFGGMYLLPNDIPLRSARYLFLPLALCWSCLAAVSWNWGLRGSLAAAVGAAVVAAWPGGLVVLKQRLWQGDVEAALVGEAPVVSAGFDVYFADEGERIVYVKEPCARGGRPPWTDSVEAGWHPRFFLHLYPQDTVSPERIDFKFFGADFATRDGSRCVVMQSLPVPVRNLESIETGQSNVYGGILWTASLVFYDRDTGVSPDLCGALAAGKVYGNNAAPYTLYIDAGEAGACNFAPEGGIWSEVANAPDTHDPVSLWLERDAGDGDHLVWTHNKHASWLTSYDAADLRGQAALQEVARQRNSTIFRVNKDFADTGDSYRAARRSIASDTPAARSFFHVHIDGNALVYVREPCARADTTSRFMLHVFPVDTGKLPEDRAEYGFSNHDFDFARIGARFDGACMATVPLPAYDIAHIRTGQFNGDLSIWQAEISMDDTPAPSKGGTRVRSPL